MNVNSPIRCVAILCAMLSPDLALGQILTGGGTPDANYDGGGAATPDLQL